MHSRRRSKPTGRAIAVVFIMASLAFSFAVADPTPPSTTQALEAEQPFLKANDAVMSKMMAEMAAQPTGNIDKDFVNMMIPHHQGAIDMAKLLLRYGRNEKLKYLAQEIIVTQQQEIAAMRHAVGDPLPPSSPSPTSAAFSNEALSNALPATNRPQHNHEQ